MFLHHTKTGSVAKENLENIFHMSMSNCYMLYVTYNYVIEQIFKKAKPIPGVHVGIVTIWNHISIFQLPSFLEAS